eukprot:5155449-Pleurochrysis_carterae.AAC.1
MRARPTPCIRAPSNDANCNREFEKCTSGSLAPRNEAPRQSVLRKMAWQGMTDNMRQRHKGALEESISRIMRAAYFRFVVPLKQAKASRRQSNSN